MQSKSGIFGEKFNEASRKKGFPFAKALHRNKSSKDEISLQPSTLDLLPKFLQEKIIEQQKVGGISNKKQVPPPSTLHPP
ncbi:MAG: hypothetical protein KIS77_22710 [Saprospiraceae bacterium]|nr:hypothetical protein [Saprospiraceae bacterium]